MTETVTAYAPVLLCALDAVGCMCESACICERLCIRANFVKLANRVIEHQALVVCVSGFSFSCAVAYFLWQGCHGFREKQAPLCRLVTMNLTVTSPHCRTRGRRAAYRTAGTRRRLAIARNEPADVGPTGVSLCWTAHAVTRAHCLRSLAFLVQARAWGRASHAHHALLCTHPTCHGSLLGCYGQFRMSL